MRQNIPSLDQVISDGVRDYGEEFRVAITRKSYGRSFLERFLMGFIWTLDDDGIKNSTRKQRMADALEALTGVRPPERADATDDWDELSIMAHWHASDQASASGKPRSIRALARQVCEIRGWDQAQNEDRLRKKFSDNRYILLEEASDDMSIEVELVHRQAMAEIERVMNILGIKFYSYI